MTYVLHCNRPHFYFSMLTFCLPLRFPEVVHVCLLHIFVDVFFSQVFISDLYNLEILYKNKQHIKILFI